MNQQMCSALHEPVTQTAVNHTEVVTLLCLRLIHGSTAFLTPSGGATACACMIQHVLAVM